MADEGSGSGPTSVAQRQMQRQSSSSRRKQPKPSDYLKLKPSTALTLSLKEGATKKYAAELEISNPSEHPIMFKVRTTNPERYSVKPSYGIIDQVSVVTVHIAVATEAAAALEKEIAAAQELGGLESNDKFRVMSFVLTSPMMKQLVAASRSPSQQKEVIKRIWMKATKSGDVAKDTLDVHPPALSVDNDGYDAPTPRSPSPAAAAAQTPAPAAAPAPAPAVIHAEPPSVVEPTPTQAPQPSVVASMPAMEELRKQYNDLVTYTITTAAQHDEQMTRANLQLEAATKKYEEAMKRIKELESGGVRRRNVTKDNGSEETKDSKDSPPEDNVRVVRTGFPLWQLILVAIVMFVVGTFMHASTPDAM